MSQAPPPGFDFVQQQGGFAILEQQQPGYQHGDPHAYSYPHETAVSYYHLYQPPPQQPQPQHHNQQQRNHQRNQQQRTTRSPEEEEVEEAEPASQPLLNTTTTRTPSSSSCPRIVPTWDDFYRRLAIFHAEYGHVHVTKSADRTLCAWLQRQRTEHRHQQLQPKRVVALERLGILWDGIDAVHFLLDLDWKELYQRLVAFQQEHGHLHIPQRYKADKALGAWTLRQKYLRREQKLSEEQIQLLDDIGYDWTIVGTQRRKALVFEEMYHQLVQYKQDYGSCNVPHGWPRNVTLAWFVTKQRELYKKNKISEEHKAALDAIGFSWIPPQVLMKQAYKERMAKEQAAAASGSDGPVRGKHRTTKEQQAESSVVGMASTDKHSIGGDKDEAGKEHVPRPSKKRRAKPANIGTMMDQVDGIGNDKDEMEEEYMPRPSKRRAKRTKEVPADATVTAAATKTVNVPVAIRGSVDSSGTGMDPSVGRAADAPAAQARYVLNAAVNRADAAEEILDPGARTDPDPTVPERERTLLGGFLATTGWIEYEAPADLLTTALGDAWKSYPAPSTTYQGTPTSAFVPSPAVVVAPTDLIPATVPTNDPMITAGREEAMTVAATRTVQALAPPVAVSRPKKLIRKIPVSQRRPIPTVGVQPARLSGNSARDQQWRDMFDKLMEFRKEHGHPNVPTKYKPDTALAFWAMYNRKKYFEQKLNPEKIRILESIGFLWRLPGANGDPRILQAVAAAASQAPSDSAISVNKAQAANWDEKYERLKRFRLRFGHVLVPQSWPGDMTLAGWVHRQRELFRKGKLRSDRRARLDALGFEWLPSSNPIGDDRLKYCTDFV